MELEGGPLSRNVIINWGFFLATLVLLTLLPYPRSWVAMESAVPERSEQVSPAPFPSPFSLSNEVVIYHPQFCRGEVPAFTRIPPEVQVAPEPQETEVKEVKKCSLKGYKVYRSLPTKDKVVALTFDDGPKASVVKLLAILQEKNVPATFFLLGRYAQKRPQLVQAIVQAGCEIGNHSWSHPHFIGLSEEDISFQLNRSAQAFAAAGVDARPYFRPPYGERDEQVHEVSEALGYKIILWNVDSKDWQYPDPEIVCQRAISGLKPGCIVLFHEGPKVTREALPSFIDEARARGYEFVLISDYIE